MSEKNNNYGFSGKSTLKKISDKIFDAGISKSKEFFSDGAALVKQADDALGVSKHASNGVEIIKGVAQDAEEKYDFTGKTKELTKSVKEAVVATKESAVGRAATRAGEKTRVILNGNIVEPIGKVVEASNAGEVVKKGKGALVDGIGVIRRSTKTYYPPESAEELLKQTRKVLININANILQVNTSDAYDFSQRFGRAIASKIAGATSAGALILAANTFGLAGTGTAIGTLSGAAHTSAFTAWLGGFVGGGSAAGTAITGGVALFAGLAVYAALKTSPRAFDDLPEKEKGIVQACCILIAAIDDWLVKPEFDFDVVQAEALLTGTLLPLQTTLNEAKFDFRTHLHMSRQIHLIDVVLPDFDQQVIKGFEYYIESEVERRRKCYPAYAVAGVIYALATNSAVGADEESQLALAALRRSSNAFKSADEAEITAIISEYNTDQLRGLTNNVKGIYHELLFERDYELANPNHYVELFAATNHPGADARIISRETGEVVREVQLKAGSSDELVISHYAKYPDTDVVATSELANRMGVETSGISNEEITEHVRDQLADMADNTLLDRASESAALSGLAAAGLQAAAILKGDRPLGDTGKKILSTMGVASGSTLLAGLLF